MNCREAILTGIPQLDAARKHAREGFGGIDVWSGKADLVQGMLHQRAFQSEAQGYRVLYAIARRRLNSCNPSSPVKLTAPTNLYVTDSLKQIVSEFMHYDHVILDHVSDMDDWDPQATPQKLISHVWGEGIHLDLGIPDHQFKQPTCFRVTLNANNVYLLDLDQVGRAFITVHKGRYLGTGSKFGPFPSAIKEGFFTSQVTRPRQLDIEI